MRKIVLVLLAVLLLVSFNVYAKDSSNLKSTTSTSVVSEAITSHKNGNMSLGITNFGTVGTGFSSVGTTDYFDGTEVKSLEFPINTNNMYLFGGGLWVGAVVGRDTLVSTGCDGWSSTGREFKPYETAVDYIKLDTIPNGFKLTSVYSDTSSEITNIDYYGLPHRPLNIEVTQITFSWSLPEIGDFTIINYNIKNIGDVALTDVHVGMYMDQDVGHESVSSSYNDDISGFVQSGTFDTLGCNYNRTINLAWSADNDGDPYSDINWQTSSIRDVIGTMLIRTPIENENVSFNWWVSNGDASRDFGPRERANVGIWQEDFRDFGTGGLGTPEGDRNKYYVMRNKEIDYDQNYTIDIDPTDSLWIMPDPTIAALVSDGYDTRYLLSTGTIPYVNPGETLPVFFAIVGGEGFHADPNNMNNLYNPDVFYSNLDFTDFINNAHSALDIFDRPGVDTDGNGYFGKYIICGNDTVYTEGDGVPDIGFEDYIGGCCVGMRGDVNNDHHPIVSISDIVYMINYLFVGGLEIDCFEEADINNDEEINLGDLVYLIDYVFISGIPPMPCD